MGSARPWFVLAVALVPAGASADNHFADVMGAGSWAGGSSLGGVQASITYVLGHHPPTHPAGTPPQPWSLIGDVSVHFVGLHDDVEVRQAVLSGGLRRNLAKKHNRTWLPFAHAMVGAINNDRGNLDGWRAGVIGGLGLDYLTKSRTPRPDPGIMILGARIQVEGIAHVSGAHKEVYPRVSLGVVLRIKEHIFDP